VADALEGVEPFALDIVGEHLDLDARQLLGQRLAASRLLPLVLANRLARRGFVHYRSLAEQRRQHGHRQLRVVVAEPLGLLPEQSELELAALLEHLQVVARKLNVVLERFEIGLLACEVDRSL
jgi:hypothetical protein